MTAVPRTAATWPTAVRQAVQPLRGNQRDSLATSTDACRCKSVVDVAMATGPGG